MILVTIRALAIALAVGTISATASAATASPRPPGPAAVAEKQAELLSGSRPATAAGTWDGPPVGGNRVATGAEHTCSLTIAGEIWCWGAGAEGQLGIGTSTGTDRPVRVTGQAAFAADDPYTPDGAISGTDIDAGRAHTCAVVNNSYDLSTNLGVLYCWGANEAGQLGTGTTAARTRPVRVLPQADKVATGRAHTCALIGDGTVSCWGDNTSGQLGSGPAGGYHATPRPVPGLTGIVSLGAGDAGTCAVAANGRAFCWGANDHGQLGDGSGPGAPVTAPTRVDTSDVPDGFAQIDVGAHHACAVDGGMPRQTWCWGSDSAGQLGDGGAGVDAYTPVLVSESVLFTGVDLGGDSTCATNYGTDELIVGGDYTPAVYCWGANATGGLGVGDRANRFAPAMIDRGELEPSVTPKAYYDYDIPLPADVTVGAGHTCAADVDGAIYCWGRNHAGQFGNRGTADADTPAKTWLAPGPPTAVRVTAGDASLRVSWRPPTDPGVAPVDSYEVSAQTDDYGTSFGQPGTTAVLRGLTNGDRYEVLVAAQSTAGYSYSTKRTAMPRAAGGGGGGLPVTGPAPLPLAATGLALLVLGAALSGRSSGRRRRPPPAPAR